MTNALCEEMISYEEYEKIAKRLKVPSYVPIFCTLDPVSEDPASVYAAFSPDQGFLLESMEGVPRRAVRSIIGIHPLAIISLSDTPEIKGEQAEFFQILHENREKYEDPLKFLGNIIENVKGHTPDNLLFSGGLTGYCRYDLVTGITGGMVRAHAESGPVMRFVVPGGLIVFDHVCDTLQIIAGTLIKPGEDPEVHYKRAVKEILGIKEKLSCLKPVEEKIVYTKVNRILPDDDRHEFESSVAKAQEYIRAGDIFQVVLSRRVSLPYTGDPFRIYRILREINPSPYLYFLNFKDEAVIGSSPEMLVKTEGKRVTTVPIAGTRPRGKNENEDEMFAQDLKSDPKERAEHLMLVDLARNDIGRVSAFGTVKVTSFMEIEKFSHVQHLTSVVSGEIQNGYNSVDVLKACFPAGTVSGAPKIRAMQIINDLERSPRGLYAGAVGYIGFDGLMEYAITIRTVIVRDGIATIQAGAGIVADSVPSSEFEETQAKAQAMAGAVYAAGGLI